MTPLTSLVSTVALTVLLTHQVTADPPLIDTSHVKPLMQMKLDRAKNILEGVVLEDFDKIASNARSLKLLSMESGWNVYQTEQYTGHSNDFRRSVDTLIQAAEDKNINLATLGYVSLTVRCVECHTYLRKNHTDIVKKQP